MKIIRLLGNCVSVFVLVACCVALLLFGLSGTGWKALIVPTGSMRPEMPPGSLALVHSVPTSTLKVGDIVTYVNPFNPKLTMTHRIIKTYLIGGQVPGFVTKGDANKYSDVPIPSGSVKGLVVWHVPYVGYWLLVLRQPDVILPVVYISALLIMFEEVKRLSDYYKKSQPYRLLNLSDHGKGSAAVSRSLGYGSGIAIAIGLGTCIAFTPSVFALLQGNTVTLSNNLISTGKITNCSENTNNNTSININNSSSQSGTTGNATANGNTNSGSATSGDVNNSNSTSTTITINNC